MAESSPIKLHHLRPAPGAKTAKTRVGRGEASKGKTAGRGTKGTGARKNVPAGFEGGQMPLQMRLPKLKGFRNRNKVVAQVVNVGDLARLFPDGGEVGPAELVERGRRARRPSDQGARHRRGRVGDAARHRALVLGLGEREADRRRRQRHRRRVAVPLVTHAPAPARSCAGAGRGRSCVAV